MTGIRNNYQPGIFQLVYASTASDQFFSIDLRQIEAISQFNNRLLRITGILVYGDRKFMQFLEGTEPKVMGLLSTIKRDPRHQDIVVLNQGFIPRRQFSNWTMRITFLSEIYPNSGSIYQKIFGLNNLSKDEYNHAIRSRSLLLNFKQQCYA